MIWEINIPISTDMPEVSLAFTVKYAIRPTQVTRATRAAAQDNLSALLEFLTTFHK